MKEFGESVHNALKKPVRCIGGNSASLILEIRFNVLLIGILYFHFEEGIPREKRRVFVLLMHSLSSPQTGEGFRKWVHFLKTKLKITRKTKKNYIHAS
jgi:hypothetical protein